MQPIKGQFRQGDVLVEFAPGATIPTTAKAVPRENGATILAHGEVTGHSHRYLGAATLFRDDGSSSGGYIEITKPDRLVHDEHGATPETIGIGKVTRQQEYSPAAIRRVED
jgi:hypothetical protein